MDYIALQNMFHNREPCNKMGTHMVFCEKLNAGYARKTAPVLHDFSIGFPIGQLTVLVGPNGCGKSSLLRAMLGLMPHQTGIVGFRDKIVSAMAPREKARHFAFLPQENTCPDYITVANLVSLGGYAAQSLFGVPSPSQEAAYLDALEKVGLIDHAHLPVNALSGGQRQRAWIAMVLAQNADVLLLDEPVNHLDLGFQASVLDFVKDLVRSQNKTVICVLHDLNLAAQYGDHIVLMDHGNVAAQGEVAAVLQADLIAQIYNVEVDVFERGGRLVCLPVSKDL